MKYYVITYRDKLKILNTDLIKTELSEDSLYDYYATMPYLNIKCIVEVSSPHFSELTAKRVESLVYLLDGVE